MKNSKNRFFPHFTELWNNLPKNVREYSELSDFKNYTKDLKPTRYKHFAKGNKYSNSLLTKIRVGRSQLNQHTFSIGLTENPKCLCHFKEESPLHYFIDCFLYTQERQTLFSLIEHYYPHFKNLNKHQKLEIILRGVFIDNPDIQSTNITLTIAVQKFIMQTKRFS